jgi:hypothetical protein
MNLIDQLPPSIEWRIYSGDTARLTVIIRDADDQLVDLTDYEFESHIKLVENQGDPEEVISVVANGGGMLTVEIPDTTILPNNTVFDIQSTSPDGVVNTILRGTIAKELDVTR